MNKIAFVTLLTTLLAFGSACNGKLSDEQRQRMKEGMERNEIKKISEAEITEAAFAFGRMIVRGAGENADLLPRKKDSIESRYQVKIKILRANDPTVTETEKQIIDAYAAQPTGGLLSDNVQNIGRDSVLYTKPMSKLLPDGTYRFTCAIGMVASRKQIVLTIRSH